MLLVLKERKYVENPGEKESASFPTDSTQKQQTRMLVGMNKWMRKAIRNKWDDLLEKEDVEAKT